MEVEALLPNNEKLFVFLTSKNSNLLLSTYLFYKIRIYLKLDVSESF